MVFSLSFKKKSGCMKALDVLLNSLESAGSKKKFLTQSC